MFAAIHDPEHAAAVLACAETFSPVVENTAPGTAILDVDGLERLFGYPREIAAAIARRAAECGFHPRIALAANPDAALAAARAFPGISMVPQGDEAKFLGDLPLRLLSPSPEMEETLARWGIRRFRDLAALPERGLASRLGTEGLRLRRLARGEMERPLVPVEEPLRFIEELELEYPVDLLEPLSFLLARLLNGLILRLSTRALATNELRLRLKLEPAGEHERTLRMPLPMLDARAFLKLLQLDLGAHPPAAPIVHIHLEAVPVKPRAAQTGLFIPLAPEPEKLEVTLARLKALAGENNVGTPELLDTHRPGAFAMRRFREMAGIRPPAPASRPPFLVFRAFRPAKPARVETADTRPARVYAEGVRGSVVTASGPWRTEGDWWTRDPWARDEWDITLSGGALYRLVCDHATGRWYVEGSYD